MLNYINNYLAAETVGYVMDDFYVIPAKAGIHFYLAPDFTGGFFTKLMVILVQKNYLWQ